MASSRETAQKCLQCGNYAVYLRARAGRTMPFRNMTALAIPADFALPTCVRCGAWWIDDSTRAPLHRIMPHIYKQELRRRARICVERLMAQRNTQRKLERLLGLSQAYLSRLYSGQGTPSPALVTLLHLLGRDANLRVLEAERYWSEEMPLVHATPDECKG